MQEYKWLDKPSGDGLWWYHGPGGNYLLLVFGGVKKFRYILEPGLVPCHAFNNYGLSEIANGKWLYHPVTAPEKPKPPQPPEVKWFTGVHRVDGTEIMVGKVGDNYLLYRNGETLFGTGPWDTISMYVDNPIPIRSDK